MSLQVELFRSDDYLRYGELALLPLLRSFFEELLGDPLDGARFRLVFLPVDDSRVLAGSPSLVNLRSGYGYVQVYIVRDGLLVYRHPHPITEIIGPRLQEILLSREPGETHWGFGIRGDGMDEITLIRPAPEAVHTVSLRTGRRKASLFQLEEVSEPDPPEAALSDLGVDGAYRELDSPVNIVLTESVYEFFMITAPFSAEVEEGGFLAGQVFRAAGHDGQFVMKITAAVPAERTGASMLNFTFTGESFLRISEQILARGQGEQLLGWYHTHLFPATDSLGLSSVDVDLHRSTFRRPWQVAALINVTDDGRMLRFYRSDDDTMVLAPYWRAG
jgi:proteasome lid subunit RPN8/RPN11